MDNNFSAQVKEIISFSREEALRLGNDFIGTEHLLLGLIREGENTAVRILKSFNVDLYELRKEVELAVKDKTGKKYRYIKRYLFWEVAGPLTASQSTIFNLLCSHFTQLLVFNFIQSPSTLEERPEHEKIRGHCCRRVRYENGHQYAQTVPALAGSTGIVVYAHRIPGSIFRPGDHTRVTGSPHPDRPGNITIHAGSRSRVDGHWRSYPISFGQKRPCTYSSTLYRFCARWRALPADARPGAAML